MHSSIMTVFRFNISENTSRAILLEGIYMAVSRACLGAGRCLDYNRSPAQTLARNGKD